MFARGSALVFFALIAACSGSDLNEGAKDAGDSGVVVDLACHPGSPMRILASALDLSGKPRPGLRVDSSRLYFDFGWIGSTSNQGGDLMQIVGSPTSALAPFDVSATSIVYSDPTSGLLVIPKLGGASQSLLTGIVTSLVVAGSDAYVVALNFDKSSEELDRVPLDGSPMQVIEPLTLDMGATSLIATSTFVYVVPYADGSPANVTRITQSTHTIDSLSFALASQWFVGASDGLFRLTQSSVQSTALLEFLADDATTFVQVADGLVVDDIATTYADASCLYLPHAGGPIECVTRAGARSSIVTAPLAAPLAIATDDACIYVVDGASILRFSKP